MARSAASHRFVRGQDEAALFIRPADVTEGPYEFDAVVLSGRRASRCRRFVRRNGCPTRLWGRLCQALSEAGWVDVSYDVDYPFFLLLKVSKNRPNSEPQSWQHGLPAGIARKIGEVVCPRRRSWRRRRV